MLGPGHRAFGGTHRVRDRRTLQQHEQAVRGRRRGYRPSDEHAPEVLRLVDEEGLSQRAIAARLGISKTTVNAILARRAGAFG